MLQYKVWGVQKTQNLNKVCIQTQDLILYMYETKLKKHFWEMCSIVDIALL